MMWELIRANKRKSLLLFLFMGLLLIGLGFSIGGYYGHSLNRALVGGLIAAIIWIIASIVSYFSGDTILLKSSQANMVGPLESPQLYHVVEEMKLAAGLPAMPQVYIIDDPSPNAFATGRNPENASIAVTSGLLSKLSRDELQGVIAHEMGHILNRDILFMTFAGTMLGCTIIISRIFLDSTRFRRSSYRSESSSRDGSGSNGAFAYVALALAILAPVLSTILYFTISRKREYLADATAARLTRYPEGLASALEKISSGSVQLQSANKVTAPMYIINPLSGNVESSSWFSTHPPTQERIAILRSMSGGAGLSSYQNAFSKIIVSRNAIIPPSGLIKNEIIPLRRSSSGLMDNTTAGTTKTSFSVDGPHVFFGCACGEKIPVPLGFGTGKPRVKCPSCNTAHLFNGNELATIDGLREHAGY